MTRCPDCGAEFRGTQCTECGLTPAAAAIVMRRRLMRRTAWFLLGAIAFLPVSQLYPPLELDGMLIMLGVVFFAALGLAFWVEWRARRDRDVEILKRVYYGFVPIPWIMCALLFVNGRFDSATANPQAVVIVGKFAMPGVLRNQRLITTSWREGRRIERVPVGRGDFDRFHTGDHVTVAVRGGTIGIPWVEGIYRR